MYILGIETSCDETAAAVVNGKKELLSNVVFSQLKIHKPYGGVVPEFASRNHLKKINTVIGQAIREAGIKLSDLNAISVTYKPGLVGSLLIGISTAKALAYALNIPLIGINHIYGHIYANYVNDNRKKFPGIALVVSGGHTSLFLCRGHNKFSLLSQTRDDAAGEAFDKVSKSMNLGYPGGPLIEKMAKAGDPGAFKFPSARFKKGNKLDFSFSGLKTAVWCTYNKNINVKNFNLHDLAAGFQKSVVDTLVRNTFESANRYKIKSILLSGGVASNSSLREAMQEKAKKEGLDLFCPPKEFCTDNGAMVAVAGAYKFKKGMKFEFGLEPDAAF
ncbi:MAG: tRNA (adenosine(37)-N6)-threonylcarbamoyltransferase complex transferase subunit TsaD [bacterium]|nr:tRNA (adenosine(37)-N6)-threonylcarbamoyltransferase complex transferase subunit TsaD [bacterium]